MYYSANFIGEECIAAGGSNQNALKFKDRISTADLSTVKNLNGGVFCFDHRYTFRKFKFFIFLDFHHFWVFLDFISQILVKNE